MPKIECSRDVKIARPFFFEIRAYVSAELIFMSYSRRDERSRHGAATESKSREKRQHHPSILVRQIQRTRDKNLRVMLLEQELRARLPKAARRETRGTTNGGVNVRQLSSPLC